MGIVVYLYVDTQVSCIITAYIDQQIQMDFEYKLAKLNIQITNREVQTQLQPPQKLNASFFDIQYIVSTKQNQDFGSGNQAKIETWAA